MGFVGHVRQHPGDAITCQGAAVAGSTEERSRSFVAADGIASLGVSVWWYLWVLLRRTGYLARDISIANDSIHIMYLACGALVLIADMRCFGACFRPRLAMRCCSLR